MDGGRSGGGAVPGGAELKSYSSAGQAVLLIGVVHVYAWLAKRYGRLLLLTISSLFRSRNISCILP